MPSSNAPAPQWSVSLPLSQLLELQSLAPRMKDLENENVQLRRELEGFRNIQYQTLEKLGDVLRQLKSCQPQG